MAGEGCPMPHLAVLAVVVIFVWLKRAVRPVTAAFRMGIAVGRADARQEQETAAGRGKRLPPP